VDNVPEVGDGGGEDECYGPVDGDHADPDEFSCSTGEVGKTKQFLEDVLVEDLDSDIAIQCSGDQASDERDDITSLERAGGRETLVGGVDGVLTLKGIDVDSKEEIDDVDEGVGQDQRLPKVEWLTHLGHELAEKHGAAV